MYLRQLHLRNFRNYCEQQVEFSAAKTILVGDNAQGKSNLLEAVELLSTLRSHRTSRDRDLIREGEALAQITAQVQRDLGPVELSLGLRAMGRRSVGLNGETLRRHLDFLGTLNLVEFSSLDLDLVRGGPEQRRHWLDGLLIQLEPIYASILQQYNQVLRQRNALLKTWQKAAMGEERSSGPRADNFLRDPEPGRLRVAEPASAYPPPLAPSPPVPSRPNADELHLWNVQLAVAGTRVVRRRARVIRRLAPLALEWHRAISGSQEDLEVVYAPNVPWAVDEPAVIQQAFLERLQERAIAEKFQGTTLVGPHRDDVEFAINQTSAKQYGSQGQQRTLVLALKLAELRLIEEVIGEPPLLLLDDVLAELDLKRQNQLLDAIQDRFQTLITTTHLGAFDAQWLHSSQILSVHAGALRVNG
jgi:DNA replication and repair protein RecF